MKLSPELALDSTVLNNRNQSIIITNRGIDLIRDEKKKTSAYFLTVVTTVVVSTGTETTAAGAAGFELAASSVADSIGTRSLS